MSEFKYACPVCGQHIKCDSSQTGTIMDCPTCFQKIIVPQAPENADQKFIITGTQYSEKPAMVPKAAATPMAPEAKKIPVVAVVLAGLLLCGIAAAAVVWMVAKHGAPDSNPSTPPPDQAETQTPPKTPPKPAVVAPPANDSNWTLALATNDIPDSTAAGRIHGQDFIVERTTLQNGTLTLRAGTHGSLEFGVQINFEGATPEALSGKTINITTNVDKAAKITFRWKDASGTVQRESYDDSYAMRLELGSLANNRLPGKIYLCTPDDAKSYLLGSFNADARKPKPKAPPKQ